MESAQITPNSHSFSQRVYDLIMAGVAAWQNAGELIVQAVDSTPDWIDQFCKRHPTISPHTLRTFERIGRHQAHPQLVASCHPAHKKLLALSYEIQEKYLNEPVELLLVRDNPDGGEAEVEVLKTEVINLQPEQAAQVFSSVGVRTPAEQRAWIEAKRLKQSAPTVRATLPYHVYEKKVIFTKPCTLSAKEIAGILQQVS